jgi:hypothetical protein
MALYINQDGVLVKRSGAWYIRLSRIRGRLRIEAQVPDLGEELEVNPYTILNMTQTMGFISSLKEVKASPNPHSIFSITKAMGVKSPITTFPLTARLTVAKDSSGALSFCINVTFEYRSRKSGIRTATASIWIERRKTVAAIESLLNTLNT